MAKTETKQRPRQSKGGIEANDETRQMLKQGKGLLLRAAFFEMNNLNDRKREKDDFAD